LVLICASRIFKSCSERNIEPYAFEVNHCSNSESSALRGDCLGVSSGFDEDSLSGSGRFDVDFTDPSLASLPSDSLFSDFTTSSFGGVLLSLLLLFGSSEFRGGVVYRLVYVVEGDGCPKAIAVRG
jgi:hypothetical protein